MGKKKQKKKKYDKPAHTYFSADCFNKTWDYIDPPEPTADQEEEMPQSDLASHWHWTQRKDYRSTPPRLLIGKFLAFAHLGQADYARRFGLRSQEAIENKDVPPFYIVYAYEARARAEAVAGDEDSMQAHIDKARWAAGAVDDEESKQMLLNDFYTIQV